MLAANTHNKAELPKKWKESFIVLVNQNGYKDFVVVKDDVEIIWFLEE